MPPHHHRATRHSIDADPADGSIPCPAHTAGDGWRTARHLLAEITVALHATPQQLHYQQLHHRPSRVPLGIRITAELRSASGGRVIVIYRHHAQHGQRGDYWSVTVNGLLAADGTSNQPASHQIAALTRRALTA